MAMPVPPACILGSRLVMTDRPGYSPQTPQGIGSSPLDRTVDLNLRFTADQGLTLGYRAQDLVQKFDRLVEEQEAAQRDAVISDICVVQAKLRWLLAAATMETPARQQAIEWALGLGNEIDARPAPELGRLREIGSAMWSAYMSLACLLPVDPWPTSPFV